MDVFDFHVHPWMEDEIAWVKDYINMGKPVLGICLGAQIIAAALGEEVYPGQHREIGWHNLQFFPALGDYKICKDLPTTRNFSLSMRRRTTFAGSISAAESSMYARNRSSCRPRVAPAAR